MRPATVFGIFTNLAPRVCVTFVQRNGQRELWERDIKRQLKQRRRRRLGFIALIPSRLIRQLLSNFFGVEL